MFEAYATESYYENKYEGEKLPDDSRLKYLKQASRHIDSLTYNRIVAKGFDNLTDFQKGIIREVACRQAEFEYENEDELQSIFTSYSINGVSAQVGASWNMFTDKGIAMQRDVYAMLTQTGLTCMMAR